MITFWFVACAGWLQGAAAPVKPAPPAEALRAACGAFLLESKAVGMTVAIVAEGELCFEEAFGQRDREAGLATEKGTLIRLASVSKPVTAVLALQLAERGKLALDEPVARYVADLPELLQPLTLRRLLSHTAGVRHYRADRSDNGTAQRTTREALALFSSDPLIAEPGTKYSYSTHAFTLVAAALEGAGERDFRALLRENLATKCAPTLDCEVASEAKPARSALYEKLALGLVRRSEPREDLSWKYAGGGLESSAADLARFADAVLRARVVSESSRDALWTRAQLSDGTSIDYGLGWGVGDTGRIVSHTGSQQGSSTALSVQRERGVVIAVLCNTTGVGAADLVPRLRQLVLDAR